MKEYDDNNGKNLDEILLYARIGGSGLAIRNEREIGL